MTTLRELYHTAIPQDLGELIEDHLEEFLEVALLVENMTPEVEDA